MTERRMRKSKTGIQKRGDSWRGTFYSAHLLGPDGKKKRIRETLSGISYAEAQRERSRLIKEDFEGFLASKILTIEAML